MTYSDVQALIDGIPGTVFRGQDAIVDPVIDAGGAIGGAVVDGTTGIWDSFVGGFESLARPRFRW